MTLARVMKSTFPLIIETKPTIKSSAIARGCGYRERGSGSSDNSKSSLIASEEAELKVIISAQKHEGQPTRESAWVRRARASS